MCLNLFCFKRNKKEKSILKCPRCNKFMNKIIKSTIEIDVCPNCKGMWVDDKEIDALLNLYNSKTKEVKNDKEKRK